VTGQYPLPLPHRQALGRADFLVAPANEAAVVWLDRWPHWPAPALALAGPAGSGKTHLAHVFQARSGGASLEPRQLAASLPDLAARAAILDEADRADEEALLHLYNLMAERRGHLLLVAREPPSRWGITLADLRSRLLAAPIAMLAPPDDALLAALMVKLFADRQLRVGVELVDWLLVHIERSFAGAEAAVAALDQAALAAKRPINLTLARAVLARNEAKSG
jgi:chromosomal replication initiation ATPase DnaA